MNKIIWLNNLCWPIYFGFCPSEKAWRGAMRRMKLDHVYPFADNPKAFVDAFVTTFENTKGDLCCIMSLRPGYKAPSKRAVEGLFVHEATHIWQKLREHIGERAPSTEFEAYTLQHIWVQLMSAYDQTFGKRR